MSLEYRVVWKRDGCRRKAKRFATMAAVERQLIRLGPEPWKASGKNPDDVRCCSGYQCPCGGMTVRQEAEDYSANVPRIVDGPIVEVRRVSKWRAQNAANSSPAVAPPATGHSEPKA